MNHSYSFWPNYCTTLQSLQWLDIKYYHYHHWCLSTRWILSFASNPKHCYLTVKPKCPLYAFWKPCPNTHQIHPSLSCQIKISSLRLWALMSQLSLRFSPYQSKRSVYLWNFQYHSNLFNPAHLYKPWRNSKTCWSFWNHSMWFIQINWNSKSINLIPVSDYQHLK